MPGFILNVHGLGIFFKLVEGIIITANHLLSVVLENASASLIGRKRGPYQVLAKQASKLAALRLASPVLHGHSSPRMNGARLILEVDKKGGVLVPEVTR
jgi:hypothetical protein